MKRRAGILAVLLVGATQTPALAADCLQQAADHYRVPVALVRAILKTEGGRPGLEVRNQNGSYDLGPMQINTAWLPTLAPRAISRAMLRDDYCVNVAVGTWILARELQRLPAQASRAQIWQNMAAYHSRTPQHNVRYAVLLWRQLKAQPGAEHRPAP